MPNEGMNTRRAPVVGSQFGECPCCQSSVALSFLNSHLDSCLSSSSSSSSNTEREKRNETISSKAVEPEKPQDHVDKPGDNKSLSSVLSCKKAWLVEQTLHLMRHGHTPFLPINMIEEQVFDVRLSPLGIQQASAVGKQLVLLKPEVVMVSPLTRALETLKWASQASKTGGTRMEVTSLHSEHVASAGDVGRPPEVLALEFPWLSFDALDSVWWFSPKEAPNDSTTRTFQSRESMDNLRRRVGAFHRFLLSRPEQVIVIIGHSTFFKVFTGNKRRMENCELLTLRI